MTINQARLHDLCLRAATGDDEARGEFNHHVPPLVEVVVRRWLHRRHVHPAADAERSRTALSGHARQITDDLCARMIAESGARLRPGMQASETLVIERGSDTLHWTTGEALAPSGS